MSPKRIYMGGLTADVSQSDVSGRFKPFGHVLSTEIIMAKAVGADPSSCRGFAYVTFEPKDDASLARMLSLYNGCKWRGQRLRVELAKPDYLTRFQQELQAEQEQEKLLQQQKQEQAQQQLQPAVPAAEESPDSHILRLTVPGLKKKTLTVDLTSRSKSHKSWFPAHKMKRPHELDWEPLPPSKRAAMQAAAEAAMPQPRPQQQVVALQLSDLLVDHQPSNGLHKLQQLSAEGHGVAVPFTYQEQQQQQQQQQHPVAAAPSAKKAASKVVQQELLGQLKLLKRIADREQQHQRHAGGGGRSSSSSKAVVDFPDADGYYSTMLQQQHDKAAAVAAGPSAAAEVATGPGATGSDWLSRFDDSDSEGEGANTQHKRRQQQDGLLVAATRPNTSAAAAAPFQPRAEHQPAEQQKVPKQLRSLPKLHEQPDSKTSSGQHNKQRQQPVQSSQQQPQQHAPGSAAAPSQSDDLSIDLSGSDEEAGSEYGSDLWEKWLEAEGVTAKDTGVDSPAGAAFAAGVSAALPTGKSTATVQPAQAAAAGAGAPRVPGMQGVASSSSDDDAAGVPPPGSSEDKGDDDAPDSSDEDTPHPTNGRTEAVGKQQHQQPKAPAAGRSQPVPRQQQRQQRQGKQRQRQEVVVSAQARKPLGQLVQAATQQAALLPAAGMPGLDRFGESESEEVLVDVDDDEAGVVGPAAAAKHKQPRDMLLCPRVKRVARAF